MLLSFVTKLLILSPFSPFFPLSSNLLHTHYKYTYIPHPKPIKNPLQNQSKNMSTVNGEILILPFFGQGHLLPSIELCKRLSSRNYKITLLISSNLSSSVPSSLRHLPLLEIAELSDAGPGPGGPGPDQQMGQSIESFLSARVTDRTRRPSFAVIDVMMSWSKEAFAKFGVQTAAFFTSGACSAAVELGASKARVGDIKPGETRVLPGLPEDIALTFSDVNQQHHRPPHPGQGGPPGGPAGPGVPPHGLPGVKPPGFLGPPGGHMDQDKTPSHGLQGPRGPPPKLGDPPRWVEEVDGSIAALMNTCDELEHPFLEYLAKEMGKPVWGVGPLLPEQYWKSAGSILHDREFRSARKSNYTEDEVVQWLDSKPRGSVIYVSFGSEVGPTLEEFAQLADALAESNWSFIWVIQPNAGRHGPPGPPPGLGGGPPGSDAEQEGYYPHGLDEKVGDRGLIICGWAPQLMILSHPSTGGFLSHCGWNSTVEGIGRGVPFLAWPIRGDQFYNAKLVVKHLKVGYMVSNGDRPEMVKEDIAKGIEKLMTDEEVHKRAAALGHTFEGNFPASSEAALDAFVDFFSRK